MDSKIVAAAALRLCVTPDRESERLLREQLEAQGLHAAAINYGGAFGTTMNKAIEHILIAARREGVIAENHREEGAVAGAAHEALTQIINKSLGLNVGGKLAVVRGGEHVSVALFFGVGMMNLNDVVVGLGHRAI